MARHFSPDALTHHAVTFRYNMTTKNMSNRNMSCRNPSPFPMSIWSNKVHGMRLFKEYPLTDGLPPKPQVESPFWEGLLRCVSSPICDGGCSFLGWDILEVNVRGGSFVYPKDHDIPFWSICSLIRVWLQHSTSSCLHHLLTLSCSHQLQQVVQAVIRWPLRITMVPPHACFSPSCQPFLTTWGDFLQLGPQIFVKTTHAWCWVCPQLTPGSSVKECCLRVHPMSNWITTHKMTLWLVTTMPLWHYQYLFTFCHGSRDHLHPISCPHADFI